MKKLGFGFMRLPLTDANDASTVDLEQVIKMTDLFMQRGFTYFDSAYVYHKKQSDQTDKGTQPAAKALPSALWKTTP